MLLIKKEMQESSTKHEKIMTGFQILSLGLVGLSQLFSVQEILKYRSRSVPATSATVLEKGDVLRAGGIVNSVSGMFLSNIKTRVDRSAFSWWSGSSLLKSLEALDSSGPFRMPVVNKFNDNGTIAIGEVVYGSLCDGDWLLVCPNKVSVKVLDLYMDGNKVAVKLSGKEADIMPGFVLSSITNPIAGVNDFVAQLQILSLHDSGIFSVGYKAVLHIHSVIEECEITELLHLIHPKTKKPVRKNLHFVKNGAVIQVNNKICVEKFADFPLLGQFTLRVEGRIVAVGEVTSLPSVLGSA